MKIVSIVVPCYFNELNIPKTYAVLKQDVLDKRNDIQFDLIFVDDGSKDNTLRCYSVDKDVNLDRSKLNHL